MSRKRRQFVLIGPDSAGETAPLGSQRNLYAAFAECNTSPDGIGPDDAGMERLHGPGFTLDLVKHADPVPQAIITINDETYAWPVIERLCKVQRWRLMDTESGRVMVW